MEPGLERGAKAIPVGQQRHDGDDAPGDAEHRHPDAEAMVIQAVQGFADDFLEHKAYISKRSASTGGNAAARRAG